MDYIGRSIRELQKESLIENHRSYTHMFELYQKHMELLRTSRGFFKKRASRKAAEKLTEALERKMQESILLKQSIEGGFED